MKPVLFHLFGIPFHAWGVAAATGFCVVAFVSMRRAKTVGVSTNRIADLLFYGAILGLIGARLGYFATHNDEWTSISGFFNPRVGGASMYGAAAAIFPLFFLFCRKHQLNPKNIADIFAPALTIGLAIHRLGCLGTGCCYGKACDLPWAIELHGQSVHPTQLYEAVPLGILAGVLIWKWARRTFMGQITWWFAVGYTFIRVIGEVFRDSPNRGFIIEDTVSIAQGVTLLLVIVAWIWLRRAPESMSKD